MKLSYDPKCNIAYIRFHEKVDQVTTLKISDEMNRDMRLYLTDIVDSGNAITEFDEVT